MTATEVIDIGKLTFKKWSGDRAPRMGAALAYYALFSMAPLLLILISIAGLVFGQDAAEGRIIGQIEGLMGREGAEFIQSMLQSAGAAGGQAIFPGLGTVLLVVSAAGVVEELKTSMNTIWQVEKEGQGILSTIKDRLLGFGIVFAFGFLVVTSLALNAALSALAERSGSLLPVPPPLVAALDFTISFALIAVLFALMYRVLPDAYVRWRQAFVGGAITALLFTIGKLAIGFYLGHSATASTSGAAGALVTVLLWIYYSSQIVFLGAEFTYVSAKLYESPGAAGDLSLQVIKPTGEVVEVSADSTKTGTIEAPAQPAIPAHQTAEPQPEQPAPPKWLPVILAAASFMAYRLGRSRGEHGTHEVTAA